MKFFKHTYLKYVLLFVLTIEVTSYVIECTFCLEQEISYTYNLSDVENNGDEEGSEELKKIFILPSSSPFSKNYIVLKRHFTTAYKNYSTQFLEFTTPPPELV